MFSAAAMYVTPAARSRSNGLCPPGFVCQLTCCGTPGPAIQMGSYRMTTPEAEIGIGEWYAQFRLPKLARTPGCLRVRKLVGIAGWAKHAILYEFTSLEDRRQNIEKPYDEWTARAVKSTIHAPGSPAVGARTWPSA